MALVGNNSIHKVVYYISPLATPGVMVFHKAHPITAHILTSCTRHLRSGRHFGLRQPGLAYIRTSSACFFAAPLQPLDICGILRHILKSFCTLCDVYYIYSKPSSHGCLAEPSAHHRPPQVTTTMRVFFFYIWEEKRRREKNSTNTYTHIKRSKVNATYFVYKRESEWWQIVSSSWMSYTHQNAARRMELEEASPWGVEWDEIGWFCFLDWDKIPCNIQWKNKMTSNTLYFRQINFFFQFHPYKFKTFRQTTYASQTSRRTDDMRWGMKSTTPNLVTEAYISSLWGAHWREEGAIIVKCFVYIDARSVMYKWRAYLRRRPCVLYIRKVEWRWYYVYRATTEGLILWQADICEIKMVDHICMMVESISTRRF